jgi:ornithine cyclodeaminase
MTQETNLAADLWTLADLLRGRIARPAAGPVFFKSCGWAGWDLAAARCVAHAAA